MAKQNKDGYVLKSDVLSLIQNGIRGIQMLGGSDAGIPQLYAVMEAIEKMPVKDSVAGYISKWELKK